ncbi:hypothetical protein [Pseudooceanicola sp.]|uniref:DUF6950 family protein n=1 Tax=Pseudooceanicola sp. TaxID=1914328 RepID=UPI0035C722C5
MAVELRNWKDRPFEYGRADCALFAAACVKTMTGADPARGLRGYRTESEGLRKVQAKGFASHVAVFEAFLAPTDRPRVGDVAIVDLDGQEATGIVQGRGVYLMSIDHGLVVVPRRWMIRSLAV